MSHALQLTDYDRRYLESLRQARRARPQSGVCQEEHERRQKIVERAIARAGSRWRLHKETGIPDGSLSDYARGQSLVPLDRLAFLENWMREEAASA